jgi:beta-lactamase class A
MGEKIKLVSCFVFTFILGGMVFYLVDAYRSDAYEVSVEEPCNTMYLFLSPLLDCYDLEEKFSSIESLGEEVESLIAAETEAGHVSHASFFYRDLNTRRFVGVNDSDRFYPASLTKLPLAIIYYVLAQLQPNFMEKRMTLAEEDLGRETTPYFAPKEPLSAGEYTLRELIYRMLVHSDNAPLKTLSRSASAYIEEVATALGLYLPQEEGGEAGTLVVTARSYANIFRVLYNASYLTLRGSNELLDILSQADFPGGIARVPAGVRVAHKFGEATIQDADGTVLRRVLNHCGIVYKPDEPYIICVMTEGQDFGEQQRVIERIADLVYEQQ